MKTKKNIKEKRELYDFDSENVKKRKKKGKHNKESNEEINENSGNEIIIGVTKYPDEEKKTEKIKKNKEKSKSKKKKNINKKIKKEVVEKKVDKIEKKEERVKNKKVTRILKWTSLSIIIIGIIAFGLMSPIFNIKSFDVVGNEHESEEKIISLSGISINQNIFSINKKEITSRIKKDKYIESVIIKRRIPDKIEIDVIERKVDFIIECGSGFAYINNQGYILEISSEEKDVPKLIGASTNIDELVDLERLNSEDLKKLAIVDKIMNNSIVNEISNLITAIDITDTNNYVLLLDTEQKKAYLGDCSDIETRILYLTAILRETEGIPGEIFVNMNLNKKDPFFRKTI